MRFKLFSIILLLALYTQAKSATIANEISNEIEKYFKHNEITPKLKQSINEVSETSNSLCETCEAIASQIIGFRKSGANRETFLRFLRKLCYTLPGYNQLMCDGFSELEIDTILYIIDNKQDLSAKRVCGIYFQVNQCVDSDYKPWSIDLPPKPGYRKVTFSSATKATQDELTVLQLTDIHFDALYKPGANSDCGLPLCCQKSNGVANSSQSAAGFWGDYHFCDMPWHSVTMLMEHIKQTHKNIDFVYFTGDIISHRSWDTTKDHNIASIRTLITLMKDSFNETVVYPILGNHESNPVDFYSPKIVEKRKETMQWLFDEVASQWTTKWLPETTVDSIKQGGFYTVLVRPGLRLIALNSNVCFTYNLWLIYEDEDPYGQLKWLVDVLAKSEENGERVHILSHIPPGETTCHQQWTKQYKRIVLRFSSTIAAQFNGHTHLDELRFFRDETNKTKIVNVAFNSGSFTTYVGFNPNYRLYKIGDNYQVNDYDQFTFNLTKANENANQMPDWYKLYSLQADYGLKSGDFGEFEDFLKRINNKSGSELIQKYYRYQVRESQPMMAKGCNSICEMQLVCSLTAIEAFDRLAC